MPPSLILGIDAAWTAHHPSGVALIRGAGSRWKLLQSASSYAEFLGAEPPASMAELPRALLARCRRLAPGSPLGAVAVDMPLGRELIRGRRDADNRVSREYGGRRKCSVHSPTPERPGRLSSELTRGFGEAGVPLAVAGQAVPALIEVYPHVALLSLMGLSERLPYKVSKSKSYEPEKGLAARHRSIAGNIRRAWKALARDIAMPALAMHPRDRSLASLKPYEDRLDAVVCAWMGLQYLRGRARALGEDGEGAIWVPKP